MKFIAHRGNTKGPDKLNENKPDYIEKAIEKGFDAEVDVWRVKGKLYLGHDEPQFEIRSSFLTENGEKLWCHAKNLDAFEYLLMMGCHTFWHQADDYTLTSKGVVWAYPGKKTRTGIYVMPETFQVDIDKHCLGVCSDYVEYYKEINKQD